MAPEYGLPQEFVFEISHYLANQDEKTISIVGIEGIETKLNNLAEIFKC
jgi:hypothetical protein